jgi:hypothetical protein
VEVGLRDGALHNAGEDFYWRKDGTSFPVEFTATPIEESGQITGDGSDSREKGGPGLGLAISRPSWSSTEGESGQRARRVRGASM